MKFQNPSMLGSQDRACIKKCDERTDGRTDERTHNPKAIFPPQLLRSNNKYEHKWK